MNFGSNKKVTIANYYAWLSPFVSWIKGEIEKGNFAMTEFTLKRYLDEKYLHQERSTYIRIGEEIACFVNMF